MGCRVVCADVGCWSPVFCLACCAATPKSNFSARNLTIVVLVVPVLDVVLSLVVFACLVVVYILVVAAVALDVYALVVVVRILVVFAMVVATCARTAIAVACAVVIDVCELSSLLWSSVWWLLVQRSSLCSRPRSCVCSGRWCNCRRQCTRRQCKCMYKVFAIAVLFFVGCVAPWLLEKSPVHRLHFANTYLQ